MADELVPQKGKGLDINDVFDTIIEEAGKIVKGRGKDNPLKKEDIDLIAQTMVLKMQILNGGSRETTGDPTKVLETFREVIETFPGAKEMLMDQIKKIGK